jgi:phenylacetic acid degradation operon negative regulatory protein
MIHLSIVANKTSNTPAGVERAARKALAEVDFRPLSARSLLLSFLLGTHPPEVPVGRLVAFAERFGVRPGTVRTALSRMVSAGEVVVTDARYRLAGRMLERRRQQEEGLEPLLGDWDGTWWTVVVTGTERSVTERRHFRAAMIGARLGELRPEVWLRPANLPAPKRPTDTLLVRGPVVDGDARVVAERLWDLAAIEVGAALLGDALRRLDPHVDPARPEAAEDLLPVAFDVSAACVRFLRAEPRLPVDLVDLPAAGNLRRDYLAFNARFRPVLTAALTAA